MIRNNIKKLSYIYFIALIIIISPDVYASTSIRTMCLDNSMYQITWENTANTGVNELAILNNYRLVLETGFVSQTQTTPYKVSVEAKNASCVCNDGSSACKSGGFKQCNELVGDYTSAIDNLSTTFDSSTGQYTIKMSSSYAYRTKIRIRMVLSNSTLSNYPGVNYNNLNNANVVTFNNGQSYSTSANNVNYRVEFYLDDGSQCSGTYLGYTTFFANNNVLVTNPALTQEYYGCNSVYNFSGVSDSIKSSLVPDCYSQQVSYSAISSLRSTIANDYQILVNTNSNIAPIQNWSTSNQTTCTYDESNNGTSSTSTFRINTSANTYWYADCTERIETTKDEPKYTTAGGGFTYEAEYTLYRTCTPRLMRSVRRLDQCTYRSYIHGGYPSIEGEEDAGPTEQFDSCIKSCDGGEYTQSCIYQCNDDPYQYETSESTTATTSPLSNNSSDIKASFLIDKNTSLPSFINVASDVSGIPEHTDWIMEGWNDDDCWAPPTQAYIGEDNCKTQHGVTFRFSDLCATGHPLTQVYEIIENGPYGTNCIDEPEQAYANAIAASRSEYQELMNKIEDYTNGSGTYTYQIEDSYLTKTNGEKYVYEVSSGNTNGPLVITDVHMYNVQYHPVLNGNGQQINNVQIGSTGTMLTEGSSTIQYHSVSVAKRVTVKLPQSYLQKISGTSAYVNGNRIFTVNSAQNSFINSGTLNSSNYYSGGNKYYTDLSSNPINIKSKWNTTGFTPTYNIKLNATGLGTNQDYSLLMKCFYGLENYFRFPDDSDPNDDYPSNIDSGSTNDGSTNYYSGFQYIFRPIDLTDLFPSRNARWNWTSSARASGGRYIYNIDPENLIRDIQSKGNNVYTDSNLDYEVILTRTNINNIRSYNRNTSYLTFNMDCGGSTMCKSTFLDNGNYVNNAGSVRVNATIGTNND